MTTSGSPSASGVLPAYYVKGDDAVLTLLREVNPYYLHLDIMERYADIRRSLRPPYGPGLIGDIDTLIAGTALQHDLVVISNDSDFDRVPGLQVMPVPLR